MKTFSKLIFYDLFYHKLDIFSKLIFYQEFEFFGEELNEPTSIFRFEHFNSKILLKIKHLYGLNRSNNILQLILEYC